jgi:hypothetical protein
MTSVAAGAFDGKSPLVIVGSDGVTRPVQTRITDRWPDGSARWLLADFVLPVDAGAPAEWRGELRTGVGASPTPASASASPAAAASAARVQLDARELNGGQGAFVSERVTVEDDGPLRATVRQSGWSTRASRRSRARR